MSNNRIDTRIADVEKNIDALIARKAEILAMPAGSFQETLRTVQIPGAAIALGADPKKNNKGDYKLAKVFTKRPSQTQLNRLDRAFDKLYNELTIGYTPPSAPNAQEAEDPKKHDAPANAPLSIVIPEKINNDAVAKIVGECINKKMSGVNIRELAELGEKLRSHNTFWAAIIGGSILLVLVGGGIFAVKFLEKKRAEAECADGECDEFSDIDIETEEEFPNVSIEEEDFSGKVDLDA